MPQLTLGPTYFRKERDNAYSNWGTAFWRENVQNSIDAGSSHIDVRIVHPETGDLLSAEQASEQDRLTIDFNDNGCGMSRDVLENVFFRLGETTKGGTDTGGFGRARIMTHFAQDSYEIRTGNLLVKGSGENYDITDADTYYKGCAMRFSVLAKDKYNDMIPMYRKLVGYLSRCQLDCNVTINGERFRTWAYRRSVTRSLSFATLHVNKSAVEKGCDGVLLVRVNGVQMYERSIRPTVQIIMEIDPEKSRDVLYSNRDGLHWKYSTELDEYVNLLASETKSALQEEGNIVTQIKGSGHFVHFRKDAQVTVSNQGNSVYAGRHCALPAVVDEEIDRNVVPEPGGDTLYDRAAPVKVEGAVTVRSTSFVDSLIEQVTPPDEIEEVVEEDEEGDEDRTNADNFTAEREETAPPDPAPFAVRQITPAEKAIRLTEEQRRRLFDLLINNNTVTLDDEDARKAVRKVIASFNPENWKVLHRKGQSFTFTGGLKAKILLIWKAICHYVVLEALEQFGEQKYEWGCGWYFGSHGAYHHQIGKVRYLLLNPVDVTGKLRFELTNKADLNTLIALAIHEVTHFNVSPHNEEWAGAVTDLTARVLGRLPEIIREIKRVKSIKMV